MKKYFLKVCNMLYAHYLKHVMKILFHNFLCFSIQKVICIDMAVITTVKAAQQLWIRIIYLHLL